MAMDLQTILGGALVIAGALIMYFKGKADTAQTKAIEADTKEADAPLAAQQQQVEQKIEQVQQQNDSGLTDQEKANRWNQ